MSITKILANKNLSDEEKLEQVAEIVASARESYGNKDVVIADKKVDTTHGALAFSHLEDESKVQILMNEALCIKSSATAFAENNEGSVLNKKVEELLATNAFFANVSTGTEFSYL